MVVSGSPNAVLRNVRRQHSAGRLAPQPFGRGQVAVKANGSVPSCGGLVRVPRRVAERRVEAFYLQRTRFESIVERKLRRRQLTEDGNGEISGRDWR